MVIIRYSSVSSSLHKIIFNNVNDLYFLLFQVNSHDMQSLVNQIIHDAKDHWRWTNVLQEFHTLSEYEVMSNLLKVAHWNIICNSLLIGKSNKTISLYTHALIKYFKITVYRTTFSKYKFGEMIVKFSQNCVCFISKIY